LGISTTTTAMPTEEALCQAIADATRAAVASLREAHPETFYYITLVTSGEALVPTLSAWSLEALARVRTERGESAAAMVKWSYADSPYCGLYDQAFSEVSRLLSLRPDTRRLDATDFTGECDLRLRAMESAIAKLDHEGLFGAGPVRQAVVVGVEVMPPDPGNTARARRLNPPEALTTWLCEAAE
jgi:hypothetical protein